MLGPRGLAFAFAAALLTLLGGCDGKPSFSHSGGAVYGWPVWGHGATGQRHSANTQITPENVKYLKVAWTYRTGDLSAPGERALLAFEATPILANNTLYLCSPRNRIAALDPVTGKEKWMRDLKPDINGATVITCRGVSYWKDSAAMGASAPSASSPAPSTARCGRWMPRPASLARISAPAAGSICMTISASSKSRACTVSPARPPLWATR